MANGGPRIDLTSDDLVVGQAGVQDADHVILVTATGVEVTTVADFRAALGAAQTHGREIDWSNLPTLDRDRIPSEQTHYLVFDVATSTLRVAEGDEMADLIGDGRTPVLARVGDNLQVSEYSETVPNTPVDLGRIKGDKGDPGDVGPPGAGGSVPAPIVFDVDPGSAQAIARVAYTNGLPTGVAAGDVLERTIFTSPPLTNAQVPADGAIFSVSLGMDIIVNREPNTGQGNRIAMEAFVVRERSGETDKKILQTSEAYIRSQPLSGTTGTVSDAGRELEFNTSSLRGAAAGTKLLRGDVLKVMVRAYSQDPADQRTYTVIADEPHELILQHIGEESDGTPSQIEFASQAEMEAVPATVANKAASPLGVQQSIRARTADSADVDAGTANRLVPADVLALRLHALQSAVNAIDVDTAVEKVARTDVADSALTDRDKQDWHARVGSDQAALGTWGPAAQFFAIQANVAMVLVDTGIKLDAGATGIRYEFAARAADIDGDSNAVAIIGSSVLNRLRANRATVGLIRSDAMDTVVALELDDEAQWLGVLANNNIALAYGGIQGTGFGGEIAQRLGPIASWAENENTDPIPPEKLANQRFTAQDATKLASIAADADVNVKADLGEADTRSDAFVRGKSAFGAAVAETAVDHLEARLASTPAPQSTSTVEDLARETGPRRDTVVTLQAVGDDVFWGLGRGSYVAPLGADDQRQTTEWTDAIVAVQWASGTRTLTLWLDHGSVWDRVWVNDEAHLLIEGGSNTVPWDPAPQAQRTTYRVASVVLSSNAGMRIDDDQNNQIRLNLGDTDQNPEAFPVGAPFVRESVVADRQTAAQVQATVDAKSDVEIRWVDSASDRPDGHTTDDRVYLYWPA